MSERGKFQVLRPIWLAIEPSPCWIYNRKSTSLCPLLKTIWSRYTPSDTKGAVLHLQLLQTLRELSSTTLIQTLKELSSTTLLQTLRELSSTYSSFRHWGSCPPLLSFRHWGSCPPLLSSDTKGAVLHYSLQTLRELSSHHSISIAWRCKYMCELESEIATRFGDFQKYGPMFTFCQAW